MQVVLGQGAIGDERNIIEVEAVGVDGEPVKSAIASLSVGVQEMVGYLLKHRDSFAVTGGLLETLVVLID